jgi:acyl-CoA reductase-like NAD-dependent aldehyde dehydrogenase
MPSPPATADAATVEIRCPADGSLLGTVEHGGADAMDRAIGAAAAAFAVGGWSRLDGAARGRVITRLADLLDAEIDDLARLDALQTGRPIREMQAQVGRLSEWLRYHAALATTHESSVLPFPGAYRAYTVEEPLGVCGLITPWNHPLLILVKKAAPALAAGNAIVVKPSELTPLSSLRFAELAAQAGIPEGIVQVVPGGTEEGRALVADPRIARLDVTGGTGTGRAIAAAAGANLVPLNLELGGKAPVIVFDDMDLDAAVSGALFATFIASGQTCVAGARVLAHASIADELAQRLARRADAIRLGLPLDPASQMGPLASAAQLERVRGMIAVAEQAGARRLTDDWRPLPDELQQGHFQRPVVFDRVTPDMEIAREEVFGPVVPVLAFEDEMQALAIANAVPTGLGASVWTRDVARAHRVAEQVKAGIVWINDHHRNAPSAPWGGFGDSGYGRENGVTAYQSYLAPRTVVVRTDAAAFDWYDGSPQRYG